MQVKSEMTSAQNGGVLTLLLGGRAANLTLPSREFLAGATVFSAIMFNFILAAINANVMDLSRGDVILAEVLIVITSIGLCIWSGNKLLIQWAVVAWLLAIIFMILCFFRQSVDPKYFRDILTVPIFIALGITYARGNIVKLFMVSQVVILAVMIFEGYAPGLFGEIVNPLKYYINTRDYSVDQFWNTESTLFISATRPEERFISWLEIHRLSSVFLEPVSLGNWCIVITIFIVTLWTDLSRKEKYFFIISNLIILIGCDGRLATVTSAIIVVLSIFALKLPRYSYFFYLPAAVLMAFLMVVLLNPPPGDTFLGRIDYTVRALASLDVSGLVGLDLAQAEKSFDSGITYIILTQSIFGAALFWTAICLLQPNTNRSAIVLMHALAAYIALSLLISYSMFSVKTAAALWFLYGYVRVRSESSSRIG